MSHFYFDLNINNYSVNELKSLIKLPKLFNLTTIENNILSIKEKIIHLKLPKDENQQYLSFLNHTKMILKNEIDEIEKKKLKQEINDLKKNQKFLNTELNIMRKKNKKIKKE